MGLNRNVLMLRARRQAHVKVWEAAQHQVPTTDTHGKEPNQPVLELPKESPPAMTRRHRTSPPLCCHITSFLESFLPFVTLLFPPSLPAPTDLFYSSSATQCVSSLPRPPPHLSLFLSFLPFTSPLFGLAIQSVPALSLSWPFFYIPVSEMSSCGIAHPQL